MGEPLLDFVPASELEEDDTIPTPCSPGLWRRLLERSAAFSLAAPLFGWENRCVDFAVNRNFTMYSYWSQHPYPPAALSARDVTLETLARIDAFLLECGARLAVATIPTRQQVHARHTSGPSYDTAFPQSWIQVFAREHGIPFLDLLPPLREHARGDGRRLYLAGDTHPNNSGHELVGQLMADWFRYCVEDQPRRVSVIPDRSCAESLGSPRFDECGARATPDGGRRQIDRPRSP